MKKRTKIILFIISIIILSIYITPKILFPKYEEPKVTGHHEVCAIMDTWIDEARRETYSETEENRSVTVKFWYPQENGTYPLVIFSHGATGIIDSNFSTCKELASNGYVVVSIGHPYQAMFVEDIYGKMTFIDTEFMNQVMTDNGSDSPEHEKAVYENSKEWLEVRTGDVNFVLDTIYEKCKVEEADIFNKIDIEKIGLFGHSLGGATVVAVGRQRDDIDAVIDLEGTMFGEYTGFVNDEYMMNAEPYPIPVLDVNSAAVYKEASSLAGREYVNFYIGRKAKNFREVIFYNAAHLNFTDLPLVSPILANMLGTGEVAPLLCVEAMNEMILHYFDYYLKDAATLDIQDEYHIPTK